jgi:hypothetical protein
MAKYAERIDLQGEWDSKEAAEILLPSVKVAEESSCCWRKKHKKPHNDSAGKSSWRRLISRGSIAAESTTQEIESSDGDVSPVHINEAQRKECEKLATDICSNLSLFIKALEPYFKDSEYYNTLEKYLETFKRAEIQISKGEDIEIKTFNNIRVLWDCTPQLGGYSEWASDLDGYISRFKKLLPSRAASISSTPSPSSSWVEREQQPVATSLSVSV